MSEPWTPEQWAERLYPADEAAYGYEAIRNAFEAGAQWGEHLRGVHPPTWSTEDRRRALAEATRRWNVRQQHDRVEQRDHDLYGMGARQGFALGAEWGGVMTPEQARQWFAENGGSAEGESR